MKRKLISKVHKPRNPWRWMVNRRWLFISLTCRGESTHITARLFPSASSANSRASARYITIYRVNEKELCVDGQRAFDDSATCTAKWRVSMENRLWSDAPSRAIFPRLSLLLPYIYLFIFPSTHNLIVDVLTGPRRFPEQIRVFLRVIVFHLISLGRDWGKVLCF